MACLIVERAFDTPVDPEMLNERFAPLGSCLERYGATWKRSYLSADGKRMFCHYEAPDAESLRTAHRVAGLDYVRIWPANVLMPPPGPERGASE